MNTLVSLEKFWPAGRVLTLSSGVEFLRDSNTLLRSLVSSLDYSVRAVFQAAVERDLYTVIDDFVAVWNSYSTVMEAIEECLELCRLHLEATNNGMYACDYQDRFLSVGLREIYLVYSELFNYWSTCVSEEVSHKKFFEATSNLLCTFSGGKINSLPELLHHQSELRLQNESLTTRKQELRDIVAKVDTALNESKLPSLEEILVYWSNFSVHTPAPTSEVPHGE